jgi:hypothetical protein
MRINLDDYLIGNSDEERLINLRGLKKLLEIIIKEIERLDEKISKKELDDYK